jgi:hypothetical protein
MGKTLAFWVLVLSLKQVAGPQLFHHPFIIPPTYST